jgi:chromosome segregation ATPase
MSVEQQLTQIKKAIEKARDMRYRAEAKLEELENQKKRLLVELEELGVKPEQLDQEIERLEKEIDSSLKETWELIPKELIEHD